jgi:starch synthase (maltosyl-transferring)
MFKQQRTIIHNVNPQLNKGQYAIKRVVGQSVTITATLLSDGHDIMAASLNFKPENEKNWQEVRMNFRNDEEIYASFIVESQGYYIYRVEAWIDYALNWQHGTGRKIRDNQQVKSELLEGAQFCEAILKKANAEEKNFLKTVIKTFKDEKKYDAAIAIAQSRELYDIFYKYPTKTLANFSEENKVYVDRPKALFSTWYEFFPRSASAKEGKHGTFKDCEKLLPRVAEMGFDVLYFPPIHSIGEINRKGKNNTAQAGKNDVGSPWGIGSKQGGHDAIHPDLGSLEDFKRLVNKAKDLDIEVAMDFALQAAPDHPYVKAHPEWFKWRPDGSVQYAENPPKKYQDIQPFYFESEDWKNMWQEFLRVALYWIEETGIRIFRVDNPHTKPFYFWGWLISEIKKKHPDVLFLAEAFTKQPIMQELAKQGFTQSYTYFSWRTSKAELINYVTELTQSEMKEYFKPNFWPNTPDILPPHLQIPNEPIYMIRYFLATTLSSNAGIYGPVFEYMVHEALPEREEYKDSEKYEFKHWNWDLRNKLTDVITKINFARKENTSLQQTNNIVFCGTDNEHILAFYKFSDDKWNQTLIICSLDSHHTQIGHVRLPLEYIGNGQVKVVDQITGNTYWWSNEWNYVELHPTLPFHLFRLVWD